MLSEETKREIEAQIIEDLMHFIERLLKDLSIDFSHILRTGNNVFEIYKHNPQTCPVTPEYIRVVVTVEHLRSLKVEYRIWDTEKLSEWKIASSPASLFRAIVEQFKTENRQLKGRAECPKRGIFRKIFAL